MCLENVLKIPGKHVKSTKTNVEFWLFVLFYIRIFEWIIEFFHTRYGLNINGQLYDTESKKTTVDKNSKLISLTRRYQVWLFRYTCR